MSNTHFPMIFSVIYVVLIMLVFQVNGRYKEGVESVFGLLHKLCLQMTSAVHLYSGYVESFFFMQCVGSRDVPALAQGCVHRSCESV